MNREITRYNVDPWKMNSRVFIDVEIHYPRLVAYSLEAVTEGRARIR